ncbi:MAG: ABC transporter ATP-binding protein [Anaerolineales bacterium]|nr:MAG: ABC transporter ATP-binding protein [Anaerolineales bacterium]
MSKTDTAIQVTGLQMRYGDLVVLNGVDFSVRRGEVLVLLGPNGAGKTTIIEILEGFRGRSGGSASVLGSDPEHADEAWRARVGIVLQSWRDHSAWRVRKLLDHFGKYFGPYSTDERARPVGTDTLLQLVGLTDHAHKKVGELSGGMRRRLDVAIGLVGNPEVLFLDEPTVGFDPKARREFHDVIHRLADLQGTTILLSTHDLDEAEKLSDRILILAGGKIVANGSADQLRKEFSDQTEVIWTQDDQRHVHAGRDATSFARNLLAQHPEGITNLEIRHASLEDAYMTIVQTQETTRSQKEGKQA